MLLKKMRSLQDSVALCDELFDRDNKRLGFAILLCGSGDELWANSDVIEAENFYRRSFEMKKQLNTSEKIRFAEEANALYILAKESVQRGATDATERLYYKSLGAYRKLQDVNENEESHVKILDCLLGRCRALVQKCNSAEGERVFDECKSILKSEEGCFDRCTVLLWQSRMALRREEIEDVLCLLEERSKILEYIMGRADHDAIAVTLNEKAHVARVALGKIRWKKLLN